MRHGFTYDTDAINTIKPTLLPLLHLTFDEVVKSITPALLHAFETEL